MRENFRFYVRFRLVWTLLKNGLGTESADVNPQLLHKTRLTTPWLNICSSYHCIIGLNLDLIFSRMWGKLRLTHARVHAQLHELSWRVHCPWWWPCCNQNKYCVPPLHPKFLCRNFQRYHVWKQSELKWLNYGNHPYFIAIDLGSVEQLFYSIFWRPIEHQVWVLQNIKIKRGRWNGLLHDIQVTKNSKSKW